MSVIVADRCDFSRGDVIDGIYSIEKTLGEGTFGVVYKVKDNAGNVFALKLLKLWTVPPEVCSGLKDRFVMEFETGQIKSNHLAHSFSYGEVKGNPYILMEFCPKGDLRSYAEKNDVDFMSVGWDVLSGLSSLHKCGKVHRDLKPENVLFRNDDTAVLTDFGISGDQNKRMTERGWLGKPSQIFGTYPYMPPEQVNPPRGGRATVLPTTDIFSFGVMMYEMLVGRLPFGELSDATLHTYLDNGKNGKWDRTALKRHDRSGRWQDIIEGCLAPDFKQRYQSVTEILKCLPPRKYRDVKPADIPESDIMSVRNGILLRVMQGEEFGREYRLDELVGVRRVLTVGRDVEGIRNAVGIRECLSSYISRQHCTIELDYARGTWVIRDGQWVSECGHGYWKESTNGTYVNSSEVDSFGMQLSPGDIISIGDVKLRVEGY